MWYTPTCSTKLLGARETTFEKPFVVEFVLYIAYNIMGSLLLQSQVLQPGAASGGSESWSMGCFNVCCLRRVRIIENDVFLMYLRHPRGLLRTDRRTVRHTDKQSRKSLAIVMDACAEQCMVVVALLSQVLGTNRRICR